MKITLLSSCTFFLLLFAKAANADTFIVTSNADNGPGTLREAIAMANANGTIGTDNIHFNIADLSYAGRTIVWQSALPNLSSHLIIDASAQPGTRFGVSDTKIKLKHGGTTNFSQGLVLSNVEFIELYGIYFNDFRYGDPNGNEVRCAIYVPGFVQNIKLGAPGKGNLFFDNTIAISNRYAWNGNPGDRFADVEIKSNFFGLNEDGITPQAVGPAFTIRCFRNITIGGATEQEGNYFASSWNGIAAYFISDSANNNGYFNITNNSFGSDHTKTTPVKCGALRIEGYFSAANLDLSDVVITVSKNTFNHPLYAFSSSCNELLYIQNVKGFVSIQGNKFGSLSNFQSCQTSSIVIINCENGIIGGNNPEDENIITLNYRSGISLVDNQNMTIQKNSIFCNSEGIRARSTKVTIPEVNIMIENGTNSVSGTATPNCKIEVFQTPKCSGCDNGEIYMGETTSDNNGKWSFTGNYTSAVSARATTQNGVTGEFAKPKFNSINVNYILPGCGQNNGSITGIQFVSGTKYYWVKNNTDTIFNQLDLFNIGPGSYNFVVEQTRYCTVSYPVNLYDNSPVIFEQYAFAIQPSCGKQNGSINSLSITGGYDKLLWVSENRDTVSHMPDFVNAGPGRYKLIVLNTLGGCGDSTEFYTLTNQAGPALNTSNPQIVAATCNNPNGSITNITASNFTGAPYFAWVDSLNNIVGNSVALLNQPAGKYQLKFKDESSCDTIITPYYTIPNKGTLIIDTNDKLVVPAGCSIKNGSISDILVSGADNLQWKNLTTGINAGNSISITGLSAGDYQLIASNAFGCTLSSPVITVPQAPFASIIPQQVTINNGSCSENNGSIKLDGFSNQAALLSYYWINSATSQIAGTELILTGLGAGTYELVATDTNGCKQTIFTQPIIVNPKPVFNTGAVVLTDDQCSLQKGSVTGIKTIGLQGPTTYTWTNTNNLVVGNSPDLSNIGTGEYRLTVTDQGTCIIQSGLFIIKNNDNAGIAPLYDEMMIQRNTAATLIVKNFRNGTYILYSDAAGTQILQQNTTGIFTTSILNADKDFYVQHIAGSCRSPLVKIKVAVIDISMFAIPTAFTPNQDGLNDRLTLKVIGYIEVEYFRIYNRNGELVFSTNTVNNGWDGNLKGIKQPSGAYVWIAKGKDISGKVIADKGNIVLVR